ncbi:putative quinol monooxygenase [Aliamphritea ceti]|uniref:putative quinol monooxygenase n=1 Tax=Aliamphritea ceti TaxID=1524258 RepID=UPI0021C3B0EE|nr:antibiotic biosynthesis monooxygenase [Aliamphritea ceti]
MNVRVTLNCKLKPHTLQDLQPFLKENLPNVRNFAGNIQVNVLLNKEHNEMLLDEEWQSVESHQAYLQFIQNNGVMEQLSHFLDAPPEIKYFHLSEL